MGSFGNSGDQPCRLHQPAAARSRLEGVEVHEMHPHARPRDGASLAADVPVLLKGMDVELLRLTHQHRLLGGPTVLEVNNRLPVVRRCNPVHGDWNGIRAWLLPSQLMRHRDAVQVNCHGLAAIAPALVAWLERQSDVRFKLMADPVFKRLVGAAPPEHFRFLSDVKFLAYASRGVVPVLKRCPVDDTEVRDGESGLLFGDAPELLVLLAGLVADPDRRQSLLEQQIPQRLAFSRRLRKRPLGLLAIQQRSLPPPGRAASGPAPGGRQAAAPTAGAARLAATRSSSQEPRPGVVCRAAAPRRPDGHPAEPMAASLQTLPPSQCRRSSRSLCTGVPWPGSGTPGTTRPCPAALERAAGLDPLRSRPRRTLAALHRRRSER